MATGLPKLGKQGRMEVIRHFGPAGGTDRGLICREIPVAKRWVVAPFVQSLHWLRDSYGRQDSIKIFEPPFVKSASMTNS